MPIWQFELALVPMGGRLPRRSYNGYRLEPLPRDEMPGIRSVLHSEFGAPCAVGTGVRTYGDLEGNRFDLIEFGDQVRELWACIDTRAESDAFCGFVCRMAELSGCELFSPEMEAAIAPNPAALIAAMMNSTAWCFALEPSIFKKDALGWLRAG